MRKPIALAMAFFLLFGCASSTVIKSNPPGAKLYLEGRLLGETPYTYSDMAVSTTKREVTLKKEGYKDINSWIKREQLSLGVLIAGIFLMVPLIWVLEYPQQYSFDMERVQ
jgi:hypothetical protein